MRERERFTPAYVHRWFEAACDRQTAYSLDHVAIEGLLYVMSDLGIRL